MKSFDIPDDIKDKIFEIKLHSDKSIFKIISYFPLSETERQIIISVLDKPNFSAFHSIFTDTITDDDWNNPPEDYPFKFSKYG